MPQRLGSTVFGDGRTSVLALAIFALRFLSDFILKHLSLFTACKPRRAKSRSLLSSGSKTHFLNLAQAISFYVSESWVNCPPITQSSKCLESLDNQTKQSLPPGLGKGPTFAKHLVCVCVVLSCVWLFAIPWTVGCQASLSMEFFQARVLVQLLAWTKVRFGYKRRREIERTNG